MKAFYQAPVGYTLPPSQRPLHLFLSRSPYHHNSHQHNLVASNDIYMCNNKHKRQTLTLSGMSAEKFPETASSESLKKMKDAEQKVLIDDWSDWVWDATADGTQDMDAQFIESIIFDRTLYKYEILDRKARAAKIMKQQGLNCVGDKDEIGCALDTIEQDIVQGKFEWKDGQDVHTNIMEALVNMHGEQAKNLTTTNQSDRCLFIIKRWCMDCIDHITTKIKRIQVALVLLAIRNEGLVLPDTSKPEDYTSLDIIVFPFVEELGDAATQLLLYQHQMTFSAISSNFVCPVTDACFERTQIGYIGGTINFDIREKLLQMVKMFASWKNLSVFIPNDEVVTYDTFIEKFDANRTSGGLVALEEFLNISRLRRIHRSNVEDAIFYLFSSFENVLEMLDLCIKFAEGISFNQEKVQSSPPGGFSDAISFVQFLKSKELSLRTSYALVGLCLWKHRQPGELTPQELESIGFPCDSLEDIHWARNLLLGKQIIFDSSTNQDSLSNMLVWCRKLHIDPQVFC